jgi:nucleotide-binding universal stress UspA family protein
MAAGAIRRDPAWTMPRTICVACRADDPLDRSALACAAALARAAGARLSVVHVAPFADEPTGVREDLLDELLGRREDVRRRRRLAALATACGLGPAPAVRVLAGRVEPQLLACVADARADLLVVGTRPLRGLARLAAPRLRHRLLAAAPCPVAFVRPEPVAPGGLVVALCGGEGAALARRLGAGVVRLPPPATAREAVAAAARCQELGATLVVAEGERHAGLRRRVGRSRTDALIEAAGCPVVVLPVRRRRVHLRWSSRPSVLAAPWFPSIHP